MYEDKVDFVVENTKSNINYENKNIKKIFEFSSGPVYIVSRKGNEKLIEGIDSVLGELEEDGEQKDANVYSKYFDENLDKLKNEKLIIGIFLIIIIAFIYIKRKDKIFGRRIRKKN